MSHVIVEVAVELELEGASLVVALHEGEVAFPLEEVQLQGAVPCEEVEVASFQEASYLCRIAHSIVYRLRAKVLLPGGGIPRGGGGSIPGGGIIPGIGIMGGRGPSRNPNKLR